MNRPQLEDLTFTAIEREIVDAGLPAIHARTLWRSLHRDGMEENFPPPLRRWIAARADAPTILEPVLATESSDGLTRKTLLRLADGHEIETVVMGYTGRFTACVSTQAGCAMGCVFCATGQAGFTRHLRPGEIVGQVLHARRELAARGLEGPRNLVLMGMGEPLHNYDAVMTALEILAESSALRIGPARMTISTVGVVPGIRRMAEEGRPYNLAVSLHGATEEERAALVPVSRRWPLAEVMSACREYGEATGRRIFFAWTLIAGVNDSPAQAVRLARLLAGLDAQVNLIPLNPTARYGGEMSAGESVEGFQRVIREAGIPCTVRQRRGIDVAAGCGQLRASATGAA